MDKFWDGLQEFATTRMLPAYNGLLKGEVLEETKISPDEQFTLALEKLFQEVTKKPDEVRLHISCLIFDTLQIYVYKKMKDLTTIY